MATGLLLPSASEVPRFKGRWILPARLRSIEDRIADYRVVTITASPGSGKTRFMTRIHARQEEELQVCCWLRVPAGTTQTGMLARQIAIVLVRSVLGEHSATASLLMATGIDRDILVGVALAEISAFGGGISLFLDDLQFAGADAIADLQILLDGAPQNLRVHIASRTPVPLRLARWRNLDMLLEIDDDDLAVDFKQVAEILTEAGVPSLTLAETRALWARTRGRVAPIRLLARNRVRRGPGRSVPGDGFVIGRETLAYFEEELFSGLSDEARGALDAIVVPHRLDHDLMVELADVEDAERYIGEFCARGLLHRVSEGRGPTYQAIPLLVDVLRAHSLLSAQELALLHRRSCNWFEERGQLALAASHAMECGDVQRAISLVEHCGIAMIAYGQVQELHGWIDRFAQQDLANHPAALLTVAWVLSLLYRLDEAEALVAPLDARFDRATDVPDALKANLGALRVMIHSMRDDFGKANEAGREWRRLYPQATGWFGRVVDNSIAFSLALAGDAASARRTLDSAYLPETYDSNPYATIYARCILGLIDLRDGQVRRAEAHFAGALKRAEADMNAQSTGTVMAAGLLAGALYEQNALEQVEQLIEGFAWSLHAHLFTDARFQAYRAKARMLAQRGQYRAAITALETVLDAGPAIRLPRVMIDVLSEKVVIALDNHDTRMAAAYIRALEEQIDAIPEDDLIHEYAKAAVLGAQAHFDIETYAPEKAFAALRRAVRSDLAGGWTLRAVQHGVLGVRALQRARRTRRAQSLLIRIIRHAARSGIMRTILDGGKDIEVVLEALAARGWQPASGRQSRLFQDLRAAFDPSLARREDAPADKSVSTEKMLTEREVQLVRFVRAGLTNRQIAERMQVSENTIKWHLKNVFEKLSVSRRSELDGLVLN